MTPKLVLTVSLAAPLMRGFGRFYRFLLCFYPPATRRRFQRELEGMVEDLQQGRFWARGWPGLALLWRDLLCDFMIGLAGEYDDALRRSGPMLTVVTAALLLLAVPVWLLLAAGMYFEPPWLMTVVHLSTIATTALAFGTPLVATLCGCLAARYASPGRGRFALRLRRGSITLLASIAVLTLTVIRV